MDINKIISFKGLNNNLDKVIDKGFAGDINFKFSLMGRELISIEARVVGARVDKFINYANSFKTIIKDISQTGRVFYVNAKYNLIKNGLRLLPNPDKTQINKEMVSEIVSQVVGSLSKKSVSKEEELRPATNTVNIKTDFYIPVTDKTKEIDSNIEGIDIHQEEHVEDKINSAVKALKKTQRR